MNYTKIDITDENIEMLKTLSNPATVTPGNIMRFYFIPH